MIFASVVTIGWFTVSLISTFIVAFCLGSAYGTACEKRAVADLIYLRDTLKKDAEYILDAIRQRVHL